jgi:hypothetical protein
MPKILIPLPKGTIDETGHTWGRLEVKEYFGVVDSNKAAWLCKCECGHVVLARGDRLRSGKHVSCGCYRADPNIRQAARMVTSPRRRSQIAAKGGTAGGRGRTKG